MFSLNRVKLYTTRLQIKLDVLKYDSTRKAMSRFRLCSHNLEIEFGRFHNIERDERKCRLCTMNAVESEYHFIVFSKIYKLKRITFPYDL